MLMKAALAASILALVAVNHVDASPDANMILESQAWQKNGESEYLTKITKAPMPFDELIYSWSVQLDEKEGFRLFLRVGDAESIMTPWLYAGYWGEVGEHVAGREEPSFDGGKVAMDQLLVKKPMANFQFKLVSSGPAPIEHLPRLNVVITDNNRVEPRAEADRSTLGTKIMDLPLRAQADSTGTHIPDRCQSAAVATAMQYFGKSIDLENILPWTYDPEYEYPGIWPRTIGAATQMGFDGYIDRFRDWEKVKTTIAEGKVILCSISPNKAVSDELAAPPYGPIGGHIVVLNGITDDGRVITTDSAKAKDGTGYLCQWLMEDFEKVWMDAKGGVGMVITPPKDFQPKYITEIPAFPMEMRLAEKAKRAAKTE